MVQRGCKEKWLYIRANFKQGNQFASTVSKEDNECLFFFVKREMKDNVHNGRSI